MKGYPKSRFEIYDQTQIQEITTSYTYSPIPIFMCPYTSDKGTEKWELISGFSGFTNVKGPISFVKHGQAQLTVAEALRSGAYVLGKRMVSEDATLANVTIRVRAVKADGVCYLYTYTSSSDNCYVFDDAANAGYGDFASVLEQITDYESLQEIDVPLFTVTPMGRGESHLFFRLVPEYTNSRSSQYIKYSFEVIEDNEILESIVVTLNPDIISDGVAQAMNPKIKQNSKQMQVKLFEDGFFALVNFIATVAVTENSDGEQTKIAPADLINMDFINGYNRRGTVAIGNVVTKAQITNTNTTVTGTGSASTTTDAGNEGSSAADLWNSFLPDGMIAYTMEEAGGIGMPNGSYGASGQDPLGHPAEYKKMLLDTFNALSTSSDTRNYDPVIYDLDAYKVDAIFDCGFPDEVKKAIVDLVDFREDMVFLLDFGTQFNYLEAIKDYADGIPKSRYVAMYHNYFKILSPYTKKEITVTMPYLLVSKMVDHISSGVGRPFAGFANKLEFSDIIEGSVNFLPVQIPTLDEKQELVDRNINYIGYYDGTPVMETMYTNQDEYTQLSFLSNVMGVQEIIKVLRTRCPRTRYTFLDGDDLEAYLEDVDSILKQFSPNFKKLSCQYMADERYESNHIFYAVLTVQFRNFIQEEYFKIIAIS